MVVGLEPDADLLSRHGYSVVLVSCITLWNPGVRDPASDPRGRACRAPLRRYPERISRPRGCGPWPARSRANTHRAPGRCPADTSRKIPVRPPQRCPRGSWGDEYCGTRFRSSRREARSIGTQPSNLGSLPYGAAAWPIEPGSLPRRGGVSNSGTQRLGRQGVGDVADRRRAPAGIAGELAVGGPGPVIA